MSGIRRLICGCFAWRVTEEEKARKCRVVGAIYILLHVNNLPACVDIFRKGIVQPECIFFKVFNAFLKVFLDDRESDGTLSSSPLFLYWCDKVVACRVHLAETFAKLEALSRKLPLHNKSSWKHERRRSLQGGPLPKLAWFLEERLMKQIAVIHRVSKTPGVRR